MEDKKITGTDETDEFVPDSPASPESGSNNESYTGEVRYTFITGAPDKDINTFAQMLLDEGAEEPDQYFKQTEIISMSGLPTSTAFNALKAYDDFLIKHKMAKEKKGTDVRTYRMRTANFLRYQAAYRQEYGNMNISTFIKKLEETGASEKIFLSNDEKTFIRLINKLDNNYKAEINSIIERIVKSTQESNSEIVALVDRINSQIETKVSVDTVLEKLQSMSEENNSLRVSETDTLLEGIRSLSDQNEQLKNLIMSGGGSSENKEDLLRELDNLKLQYRDLSQKYEAMVRDVNDYLDRIDDEAMRMNKDTDNIGFMGLNKLKAANKDHYERIKSCIDQAKRKIGS